MKEHIYYVPTTAYYMPGNVLGTVDTELSKTGCLPSRDQTWKQTATTEHKRFEGKWVSGALGGGRGKHQLSKHMKTTIST